MKIDIQHMVSIAEATRDFSRVAKMVDESGMAVISNNDVPRYVVTEFRDYQPEQTAEDEKVMRIALALLDRHHRAFENL